MTTLSGYQVYSINVTEPCCQGFQALPLFALLVAKFSFACHGQLRPRLTMLSYCWPCLFYICHESFVPRPSVSDITSLISCSVTQMIACKCCLSWCQVWPQFIAVDQLQSTSAMGGLVPKLSVSGLSCLSLEPSSFHICHGSLVPRFSMSNLTILCSSASQIIVCKCPGSLIQNMIVVLVINLFW